MGLRPQPYRVTVEVLVSRPTADVAEEFKKAGCATVSDYLIEAVATKMDPDEHILHAAFKKRKAMGFLGNNPDRVIAVTHIKLFYNDRDTGGGAYYVEYGTEPAISWNGKEFCRRSTHLNPGGYATSYADCFKIGDFDEGSLEQCAIYAVKSVEIVKEQRSIERAKRRGWTEESLPVDDPTPTDLITELERLASLKERGAITGAEFEAAKRKLLGM